MILLLIVLIIRTAFPEVLENNDPVGKKASRPLGRSTEALGRYLRAEESRETHLVNKVPCFGCNYLFKWVILIAKEV
jgi:hypothetical protein